MTSPRIAARTADRRLLLALVGSVALVAAMLASPARSLAFESFFPLLSGDQEVPGPGDPDGDGAAQIDLFPDTGEACVSWDLLDIEAATAAHIHAGAEGVSGGVVVELPVPEADGTGGGCTSGLDSATLQAILDDPNGYYVNVHTDGFPDGAVRGQLGELVEWFSLSIGVVACPADHEITDQLEVPEGCLPVLVDIPTPPDGYTFDPEPIQADLDLEVDDGDLVLTQADAEFEGGSTCNPATLTCGSAGVYSFPFVLGGETIVSLLSPPTGYEVAGAALFVEGEDPEVTETDETIVFDSTVADTIQVRFYLLPVAAPTPTPTPTPTVGPVSSAAPTIPPTSTAAAGAMAAAGPVLAVLAITGVVGLAGSLALIRRPRRGT